MRLSRLTTDEDGISLRLDHEKGDKKANRRLRWKLPKQKQEDSVDDSDQEDEKKEAEQEKEQRGQPGRDNCEEIKRLMEAPIYETAIPPKDLELLSQISRDMENQVRRQNSDESIKERLTGRFRQGQHPMFSPNAASQGQKQYRKRKQALPNPFYGQPTIPYFNNGQPSIYPTFLAPGAVGTFCCQCMVQNISTNFMCPNCSHWRPGCCT